MKKNQDEPTGAKSDAGDLRSPGDGSSPACTPGELQGGAAAIASFPPSSLVFSAPIPFIGTLGRVEREIAACMLVAACAHYGDRWQALGPREMGEWLTQVDQEIEPWKTINTNPFARPDFHDLVKHGYAEGSLAAGGRLSLTTKAFEALRRWSTEAAR